MRCRGRKWSPWRGRPSAPGSTRSGWVITCSMTCPTVQVRGPWEVWTALAALACVTERVELGPLVASTSFHAPAMLAKLAATVDAISGGRLDPRPRRRLEPAGVHRVRLSVRQAGLALRGGVHDHPRTRPHRAIATSTARTTTSTDCVLDPRPVRPGGPPLMLGSVSPRMMRIGLPHVDAWNVWWSDYGNDAEGFAAVRRRVEERRRAGRPRAWRGRGDSRGIGAAARRGRTADGRDVRRPHPDPSPCPTSPSTCARWPTPGPHTCSSSLTHHGRVDRSRRRAGPTVPRRLNSRRRNPINTTPGNDSAEVCMASLYAYSSLVVGIA